MKPHLLVLLLLAIPPLISNILACENAEKTDVQAPAKSERSAKDTPSATPAPARAPAAAPARAEPGNGHPSPVKAWNIM